MNRSTKNRLRGKQRRDAVDIPQLGPPYVLSRYNGRANYSAGQYDIRVVKPLQPDGTLAQWQGVTPADK